MGDGRVALITGGASGIGRALGEALAERGARVVLADRQLAAAEALAVDLRKRGHSATATALDVRDPAEFERVVAETEAHYGRIDLFFNNAGIAVGGPAENYEPRDWFDVLDVNLNGVIHGIQSVYPRMIRQGSGHIINTASMAGLIASSNLTSYAASKHAVVGLSKALRIEARRHGVRVSTLCPGFIRTAILHGGAFGRMKLPGVSDAQMTELIDKLRPMDPTQFAQKALRAIDRNQGIIVLPSWYRAVWLLERIAPAASSALWTLVHERGVREAERLGAATTPEPVPLPNVRGPRAQA